ncbi:MAG: NADH-quinone oxidoreductase subunit J [Nitrospirae bacterium]|nr:NADH-quinone oxidoreductase subunit J [Candidatus Manganitrophaceae bacterium]
MILGGAVVAITSPNLIYSALALLVTLIHVAGIYVLLSAEFVAAVQVIVYAGAILVLYLFVLMIFSEHQGQQALHATYPVGVFLGGLALVEMLVVYWGTGAASDGGAVGPPVWAEVGNTQAIGALLYTKYLFPFEIASIILLVAMVGAITLGKRTTRAKEVPAATNGSANGHAAPVHATPVPRVVLEQREGEHV